MCPIAVYSVQHAFLCSFMKWRNIFSFVHCIYLCPVCNQCLSGQIFVLNENLETSLANLCWFLQFLQLLIPGVTVCKITMTMPWSLIHRFHLMFGPLTTTQIIPSRTPIHRGSSGSSKHTANIFNFSKDAYISHTSVLFYSFTIDCKTLLCLSLRSKLNRFEFFCILQLCRNKTK